MKTKPPADWAGDRMVTLRLRVARKKPSCRQENHYALHADKQNWRHGSGPVPCGNCSDSKEASCEEQSQGEQRLAVWVAGKRACDSPRANNSGEYGEIDGVVRVMFDAPSYDSR